ncbi:MAG TPA: TlpA disulfide reductase family protein [Pyrinomonadaceae bacterium]|nr:TlpA disulfide reductase family protein [Pyrinomonadaceae bacterium]
MRLLLILAAGCLFFVSCRPAAAPVTVGNKPVSINDVPLRDSQSRPTKPISEMSWTDFNGNIGKIKDHSGKAIILDFWATNCPPCIEAIPHLKMLQAKYGPENLVVVGLHVGDDEDKEKVPEFVDRLEIDYTMGYPEQALTSFIFGQETAIPQTAIFDRNGQLMKRIIGFNDKIKVEIDEVVDKAVASHQ